MTGAGKLFGQWNEAKSIYASLIPRPLLESWKGPGYETKIYASILNQSTAVVLGIVASCNCPWLAQATSDRIVLPRAYNLSHWRRHSWFAYTHAWFLCTNFSGLCANFNGLWPKFSGLCANFSGLWPKFSVTVWLLYSQFVFFSHDLNHNGTIPTRVNISPFMHVCIYACTLGPTTYWKF